MDVRGAVRDLKAAGFTDAQACAVTRLLGAACGPAMPALATRADLRLGLAEARVELWKSMLVVALAIQAVAIIGTVAALLPLAHG
jgi:hypothetical protein